MSPARSSPATTPSKAAASITVEAMGPTQSVDDAYAISPRRLRLPTRKKYRACKRCYEGEISERLMTSMHNLGGARIAYNQSFLALPRIELRSTCRSKQCVIRAYRPYVGLSPTTPHQDAGCRTEPPVSVPREPVTTPDATAAADPPAHVHE